MEQLALLRIMDAKLAYASQRQTVLANNIANANTPGFQPSDVKVPDFKKLLRDAAAENTPMQGLAATDSKHIGLLDVGSAADADNVYKTATYEVAPDGNGVDLEEQMLKASKNNSEVGIVVGLYAKQLSFLRTAVGAGR